MPSAALIHLESGAPGAKALVPRTSCSTISASTRVMWRNCTPAGCRAPVRRGGVATSLRGETTGSSLRPRRGSGRGPGHSLPERPYGSGADGTKGNGNGRYRGRASQRPRGALRGRLSRSGPRDGHRGDRATEPRRPARQRVPRARPPLRRRRPARQRRRAPRPSSSSRNFGLTEADLDKTFPTSGMSGLPERATLREIVAPPERDVLLARSASSSRTSRSPSRATGSRTQMESTRNRASLDRTRAAAHPHEADRGRDLRAVHPQELRRRQALLARGRREHDPDARSARRGGRRSTASKRSSSAWRTAGASTCSSTCMGKNVREIFAAFDDKHAGALPRRQAT